MGCGRKHQINLEVFVFLEVSPLREEIPREKNAQFWTFSKSGLVPQHIYGRICLDGYLTKQLGIFPVLYVHTGEYLTTFEVF